MKELLVVVAVVALYVGAWTAIRILRPSAGVLWTQFVRWARNQDLLDRLATAEKMITSCGDEIVALREGEHATQSKLSTLQVQVDALIADATRMRLEVRTGIHNLAPIHLNFKQDIATLRHEATETHDALVKLQQEFVSLALSRPNPTAAPPAKPKPRVTGTASEFREIMERESEEQAAKEFN